MNIKDIKNFEELNLRQTLRAHILYEQIMGHAFTGDDGLNGVVVLFFSYIAGSNRNANIDYNDYLDWLDEHNEMLTEFTAWMVKVNQANESIQPDSQGEVKEAGK